MSEARRSERHYHIPTDLRACPDEDATDRGKEDADDEEQRQHTFGGQDRSRRKASVSLSWRADDPESEGKLTAMLLIVVVETRYLKHVQSVERLAGSIMMLSRRKGTRTGGSSGLGLLVAIGRASALLLVDGLGTGNLGLRHGDRYRARSKTEERGSIRVMERWRAKWMEGQVVRETSEKGGAGAEPNHWI